MIQKSIPLVIVLFLSLNIYAQEKEPLEVVKASLTAYNNVDIDVFMSYFLRTS
tara:strand:+ start:716 stop:874 length:159 start_codon:yes stop_codon:yes gene_type:complete